MRELLKEVNQQLDRVSLLGQRDPNDPDWRAIEEAILGSANSRFEPR
jgi:hypothetical protein